MRLGLLVIVTAQLALAQQPIKLGEVVHNLIFPSEHLMGMSVASSDRNKLSWISSSSLICQFNFLRWIGESR